MTPINRQDSNATATLVASVVTMNPTGSGAFSGLEENRETKKKGSSFGVIPRSCIANPPTGNNLPRAARKAKLAALGEVPPVKSLALEDRLVQVSTSKPDVEHFVDEFIRLLGEAEFTACSISHARSVAKILVQSARQVVGREPQSKRDLLNRTVVVQAIAQIRSTRSAARRLPMLVRFVNFLHTDQLVDRTAVPECEEIRLLCRRPVTVRPPRPISLDPSLDHPLACAFIRELDAQNKRWQKRAKLHLRSLLRWLHEHCLTLKETHPVQVDVTQISAEYLLGYFHHLSDQVRSGRMAKGSFRLQIQTVRRWFAYLYTHGFIYSDPTITLPTVKGRESAPHRIISVDEARAFIDAVLRYSPRPLQDLAIFSSLSGLGLRPSEVVNLRVADVDRSAALLRVLGKGNKERSVPLPGPVLLSLERHLASRPGAREDEPLWIGVGGPLSYGVLLKMFHRYCRLAGINRNIGGPHVFRHFFVTENLLRGVDLEDLAALVGHDNLRSLEGYWHTADAGIRTALLKAYGDIGGQA